MKRKSHSIEDLRSYLLGSLPGTDTEHMDELSITDDEFADELGAAEKDLIDSYVHGELDGDILRRFEEYYLASPLRREKVRFAQAFKEYSDERMGPRTGSEQKPTSLLSLLTGFGRLPVLAGAALVIMIAILGWLAVRDPNDKGVEVVTSINSNADAQTSFPSPDQGPQPSPTQQPGPDQAPTPESVAKPQTKPVIASFVLRAPLRGTNVPEVRIPATATRASARLELESDDFASYSVELVNGASGPVVWRSGNIKPGKSNGTPSLSLNIPASTLIPSLYTMRVSGRSSGGVTERIGDYPFRVVQ